MANRPVLENRPGTDLPGLQAALKRYVQDLDRYLAELAGDIELPDVGPGAGTYGGDGEIVESVTLDDEGRTTALTTTARATTEGGVMSMVGPAGASAPVVAYDFTRYNPASSVATNLAAANLSGNSAYDLTAVGGAQINYLALSGDTGQSPFAWTPIAASSDGGALVTGRQTDYVVGSASPAGLQLLGALTVEWLGYVTEQPAAGDMFMWDFSAAGELEAANVLYLLRWNIGGNWIYDHESGAGVDSTRALLTNATAQLTDMLFSPALITLTRAASGTLNFYINGRKCFTQQTAAPSALPTGGTTSNLSLGFGAATSKAEILGFRIFNTELTAAQVRASYQRTFFGVSV